MAGPEAGGLGRPEWPCSCSWRWAEGGWRLGQVCGTPESRTDSPAPAAQHRVSVPEWVYGWTCWDWLPGRWAAPCGL